MNAIKHLSPPASIICVDELLLSTTYSMYNVITLYVHTTALQTNFYRQIASYSKRVGHHKVVNYQQNGYLTVIGVHSTMHSLHLNYCQIQ